jgi:dihydroorotate dehydrogenase (fumarate)
LESIQKLRDAGVAAIILPSIFEEQIEHDEMELARLLDFWALSSPETSGYFPELDNYNTGPDEYLERITRAKRMVEIPIVASLNGYSLGGWLRFAGLIEQAGADALELNIYQVPVDPELSASGVELEMMEIIRSVSHELRIPVSVKIGHSYSSMANTVRELSRAGAKGIAMFNRYLSPDIDLEARRFVPALELSESDELRLALRWLAIVRDQVDVTLIATGGVHTAIDIVKAVMAGADATAVATILLRRGIEHASQILQDLSDWLSIHEYASIAQMRGSLSWSHCPNPDALRRANYMRALMSYTPSSPT